MLEHDSHVHGWVRDFSDENAADDVVGTHSLLKRDEHTENGKEVMYGHVSVKQAKVRHS